MPHSTPIADEYAATLRQYNAAKAEYAQLKQVHPAPRQARQASSRLYLVSRRGPSCFLVADAHKCFRVTIGTRHTCSCHKAVMPCSHVAWVMTRCLRADHKTSQQAGLPELVLARFLEVETSQPVSTRRGPRQHPPGAAATPSAAAAAAPTAAAAAASAAASGLGRDSVDWLLGLSGEEAWLLAQPRLAAPSEGHEPAAPCRALDADDTCAICMEPLVEGCDDGDGKLTFCRHTSSSCGRALHEHCLRVWARHQDGMLTASGGGGGSGVTCSGVTCPMCRAPWGPLVPTPAQAAAAAEATLLRERQSALRDEFEQLRLREAASEVVRRRQAVAAADATGGAPSLAGGATSGAAGDTAGGAAGVARGVCAPCLLPSSESRAAGVAIRPCARRASNNEPVSTPTGSTALVATAARRVVGVSGRALPPPPPPPVVVVAGARLESLLQPMPASVAARTEGGGASLLGVRTSASRPDRAAADVEAPAPARPPQIDLFIYQGRG